MTDDRFELTRRKALVGLGAVGAASAGAGLGSTAFFSDEERFTGNQLTAGSLDMKVSWEEHYSDWSEDEADFARMAAPDENADVDLPSLVNGDDIRLVIDDQQGFMDATLQEQFPDEQTRTELEEGTADPCEVLADVPDDLQAPVIELQDVKPGDFGEVTFDFALCDNPGYVWLTGSLLEDLENSVTEPEGKDDDEDNVPGGEFEEGDGELAENLHVLVWYDDDCDNLVDPVEEVVLNTSLRDAMDNYLDNGVGLPLHGDMSSFASPGTNRIDIDGGGNAQLVFEDAADPAGGGGTVAHGTSGGDATVDYGTSIVALDDPVALGDLGSGGSTLTYEYYQDPAHEHAAPDEVWLVITESDGTEHVVFRASNDQNPASGETARSAGQWHTRNVHREVRGDPQFNPGFNWMEIEDDGSITNLGGGGPTSDLASVFGSDATIDRIGAGLGQTGSPAVSSVYYRNLALDDSSLGEFPTGVNTVAEGRECFDAGSRFCVGVAWYLPIDHANEVQTDSVAFDIGFYTEQCRHNPGTGLPPESTPAPTPD